MTIKPILAASLESALNRYLAMDYDAPYFLKPLAGKVIAITITPFGETLYLCPNETNIQIMDTYVGTPDTCLSGSLMAFGLMGLSNKPMRSVFSGEISVTGDMHTGRKFQELFDKIEIDIEETIAKYTGDIIAHKIGFFARSGRQWGMETLESLRLNIQEFLQEESRDLPASPEAEIFYRNVDSLRSDYDRLTARLDRLSHRLESLSEEKAVNDSQSNP